MSWPDWLKSLGLLIGAFLAIVWARKAWAAEAKRMAETDREFERRWEEEDEMRAQLILQSSSPARPSSWHRARRAQGTAHPTSEEQRLDAITRLEEFIPRRTRYDILNED